MKKNGINEDGNFMGGHRVISPALLLNNNKKEIEQLLKIIAKKYSISVKDAAVALSKTLENLQ